MLIISNRVYTFSYLYTNIVCLISVFVLQIYILNIPVKCCLNLISAVTIDLKLDHFKPNKPNYEKTKLALKKLKNFTIILFWEPPTENICPSSIAKFFCDLGYTTKLCQIKYNSHLFYSPKVPIEFNEETAFDFIEWLGIVSLQCKLNDEYLSSYLIPEPSTGLGQTRILKWRGFFTCTQIQQLFTALKKFQANSKIPWLAMYVQGFSDAPISWRNEENHFYTNGDNGYVIVFDNKKCLFCCQRNGRKKYRHKYGK